MFFIVNENILSGLATAKLFQKSFTQVLDLK